MPRLQADADPNLWVPVTESLGFRGRRHRKTAIRMLLNQAGGMMIGPAGAVPIESGASAGGQPRPGNGFAAWAMSQAAPFLMRKAAGRVLVWVWKADAELVVVMAQVQQATNDLRAARAMMPMEYDDTESFRNPYLGVGEKLEMALPSDTRTPPFATYTWDTGTHFVTVTAVCSDRERFGTVIGSVDDLARTLRIVDDLTVGESPEVLRIEPKN
ncbi:hypothetical protein JNB63_07585 [Microbacterium trichothecenolyticum]|uniref:Uncharacterized protein n=1 Tax=Microbacterium ureisolvens TaxID=2781186 RepID=A0ABS7HVL3_9MICO|nr:MULTISPECIES: hypothetical protein [Microbacterium]MBW9109401.1 hypothetical protein [Microbacterium ureisolvens]MBW9119948.1 hypothetical protein [Microbacterium trichothecenolyticum]